MAKMKSVYQFTCCLTAHSLLYLFLYIQRVTKVQENENKVIDMERENTKNCIVNIADILNKLLPSPKTHYKKVFIK